MKSSVCPICKGPRKPAPQNSAYPFCSPRCKLADLSNWMSERYVLEGEPASLEDDNGEGKPTLH